MPDEQTRRRRKALFRIGLLTAVLSAALSVCSWIHPFPLLSDGQGGWRMNPLGDWVLFAGLSTGLLTMVLAFFGSRLSRIVLVTGGLLLLIFNGVAWLGNNR